MRPENTQNATPEIPSTSTTSSTSTRAGRKNRRSRSKRLTLLAGGLVLAGVVTGTGFTVQSAVADQQQQADQERDDRAAAKAAAISKTHLAASVALVDADTALEAAANKVDASALSATSSTLAGYYSMPLSEVSELTTQAKEQTATVQAAAVEADRVAVEAAAAQAAADAQAAAEAQAAADAVAAGNTPAGAKATAASLASSRYGWGESQFSCLAQLWQKESEWKYTAYNDNGGATGIPQALPGSKMASAGSDWATNASTQIAWGLEYINGSYGTPCAAWSHSQAMNWY
ncbi:phospholipase [Cryobacterium sp. TMB1-7]|uniref:aggregation-promoting factor C-terminal-like domain-containing protein n=1 Tax=Cryobacterium sp. TMB1-7 TaxID=2555866 RepID=UPI001069B1FE|nr:phospholipase [Cryobacterium sp. TMB1-7]TFC60769.1 phospholipase [Cryobacterium sp. TMB1-7]